MGEDGRQTEEPGPNGWLPPLAPGAQAPRRWHTVPEPAPGTPAPPSLAPPPDPRAASGAAPPHAPAVGGASSAGSPPDDAWWRGQHGAGASSFTAPAAAPARTNGHAVAALTLGIAGIVLFFASGFGLVFVLNLPCSILAWMFGRSGVRRVDRGETPDRRGMAKAGMVLGIVGTVVGALAVVGWAIGFVFSEELRDQLRREWERQQGN